MRKRDLEIKLVATEARLGSAEHRVELAEAAYKTAIRDKKAAQARLKKEKL